MALKYYNGLEKKKLKNQEIKSENQMSRLNSISMKENIEINIKEERNDYILMLKKIFEKLFGTYENILEDLIKKYLVSKTEKNNEFNYEDFIVIFCSIIKYYTGLHIALELNENENYLFIFIYGDDKTYTNICKIFNYELQLKPIAINYENHHLKSNANDLDARDSFKDIEIIDYSDKEPLLQSFNKNKNINNLQFEDYDINNPIYWPPYFTYKSEKDGKFRDYESNDDYYYPEINNTINNINNEYIKSNNKVF